MIRFILDMPPRSSITCNVLQDIGLLTVNDRVKQLRLNHAFNIFHDTAPSYLGHHFCKVSSFHSKTRFSENNFIVPKIQGCQRNTFYYQAIQEWNSLPNDIKKIDKKHAFKYRVKRYMFDSALARENSSVIYY